MADFRRLLDQITKRFSDWTTKGLSFAGRLQLISAVIYGTVNFWFSAFILPKACIKKIETLCGKFLWAGNIEGRHNAKVSWKTICYPKDEGGLGLRDFGLWNKILGLRLIWMLFSKSGSLWVAWNREHHLQRQSFWSITAKSSDSWLWRALLSLRPLISKFIHKEVRDGVNTSFWFDEWTGLGPLIQFMGCTGPAQLGVSENASVSEASGPNGWSFRAARSEAAQHLQMHISSITPPSHLNGEDVVSFRMEREKKSIFSTHLLWEHHRKKDLIKNWAPKIWFKGNIPSQAFNMWITNMDRLPTRSRLVSWGMQVPSECGLCASFQETREHLFLHCDYSNRLWQLIHQRLRIHFYGFQSWDSLMLWPSSRAGPLTLLKRLVSQAAIYLSWRERNDRIHSQQSLPPEIIFRKLDKLIQDTILSKLPHKKFSSLMSSWL